MIRFLILLLTVVATTGAFESSAILGMRCSKYGFVGYEYNNKWGLVYENSIFIQDVELQHGKILGYYHSSFNTIDLYYALFYGSRFNQDYYDYGGIFSAHYRTTSNLFHLNVRYQPFSDSDFGFKHGYYFSLQVLPFNEIGLFLGVRNLPDFRETERRLFGGIVFELPHLVLQPEISTPVRKGSRSVTRLSVNFIYKAPL